MSRYLSTTLAIVTEGTGRYRDDEQGRPAMLSFRKAHPDQRGGGWLIVNGAFPAESPEKMFFTDDDARALLAWLQEQYGEEDE